MEPEYNFQDIEKKWQQVWKENKLYKVDLDKSEKKLYCLVMFFVPFRRQIAYWTLV